MKKRDLTIGNINKSIIVVAVPLMISSVFMFLYNLADLFFIGKYSNSALNSISSASFYLNFGIAINTLVIMGLGIVISQSIGAKDDALYHKYMNAGIVINLVLAVISFLVFYIFAPYFISLLQISSSEVVENAIIYLRINSIIFIAQYFNQIFARVLSSFGRSENALYVSSIGIIINIILDPIFIFVFDMGVAGAAYATLIGNLITLLIFYLKYFDKFKYDFKTQLDVSAIKKIVQLGFPYSLQRIIFTLVGLSLAVILSRYTIESVTAYRVGLQVEMITLFVVGSFVGSMNAFTGQNFGALQYDRIKKAYNSAIKIGEAYVVFTGLLFLFFAPQIMTIFSNNQETIEVGTLYLRIIAIGQFFAVFEMVGNGVFSGLSLSKIPTSISIPLTVARIPLAFLLTNYYGIAGVFIAILITSILKGLISFYIYYYQIRPKLGNKIQFQR